MKAKGVCSKVWIGHQKQEGSVDELLDKDELHDRPDDLTVLWNPMVLANPTFTTLSNMLKTTIVIATI